MVDDQKHQIFNDIINFRESPSVKKSSSAKVSSSSGERSSSFYLDGQSLLSSSHSSSAPALSSSSLHQSQKKGLMENTPFPEPVVSPTQKGELGICFDFNMGARVSVPEGFWKIRLIDEDTETILYEVEGEALQVMSRKKHFLNVRLEIEQDSKIVWTHKYNATGKDVAVVMPGGTLGDTLGWFPYALRFSKKHHCKLHIVLAEPLKELLEPVYPDVNFMLYDEFEVVKNKLYATYYLGLFFSDEDNDWQPSDFRLVGLHRTAGCILGVDITEEPPQVEIEHEDKRPIEEPYVVVAVQASCGCKMWNNPLGWIETVEYLTQKGYRVICIDRDPVVGEGASWNALPLGVEDETGNRPLAERARWLKHADFFIGLSSGLSWLSWAVHTPVVMISGFTHPSNEFYTPYRVFSSHGCNSCWHDVRTPFQHDDYMFCPRHKGTSRYFECTRIINSDYVIKMIDRVCDDYKFQVP